MFNREECLSQLSKFCRECMSAYICNDVDCEFCCINEAFDTIRDETFGLKADIVLEVADLISCNMQTGTIKVDKLIFDDFVQNTHINIKFVDTDSDKVFQYVMISEDDEGIIMECEEE